MSCAALYVRVSTEEQSKYGFSIEAQLESLRTYCAAHRLSVYRSYVDAGISGKSMEGREQLNLLLEDAKLQRFQHVVVWRLSRLSRSLSDLLDIVERLSSHDVELVSLNEQFDTRTPIGRFTLQMMGAAAQLERDQIAENVSLSAVQRAKQGKWNCGNNVLGYRWVPDPDTGGYAEIVSEEAAIVRRIFELYATEEYGYKAITNILNKEGHRTKKGGFFHINAVRNILTNMNYIGKIRFNVTESRRTKGAVPIGWVNGEQESIVPLDLWNRVQDLIRRKSSPPQKIVQRDYPLAGVLKCPQCGNGMIPQHTKAVRKNGSVKLNHYYACGNYLSKGIAVCKPNSVRADDIETWLFNQLQAAVSSTEMVQQLTATVRSKQFKSPSPLVEQTEKTQRELSLLEEERKRFFQAYEDGMISKERLKGHIQGFQLRSEELRAAKDDAELQMNREKTESVGDDHILAAIRHIHAVLDSADAGVRRRFLRLFIDKITLPPDRRIQGAKLYTVGALGFMDLQTMTRQESQAKGKEYTIP